MAKQTLEKIADITENKLSRGSWEEKGNIFDMRFILEKDLNDYHTALADLFREEWERMRIENRLIPINPTQSNILKLMETEDINKMSLREIGSKTNTDHPQKVKHHLEQLIKHGLVNIINGKKVLNKPEKE